MKQLLVVKIHSFVDVITNSSSELFVCRGDKSLSMVETIMATMTPSPGGYSVRHPNDRELLLSKYWNKAVADKYGGREVFRTQVDKEDLEVFDANSHTRGGKEPSVSSSYGYEKGLTKDTVIIESDGDNSMDYDCFDEIESLLDASRYHLG